MSSISFHSKQLTVRISGRERALMSKRINDLFLMACNLTGKHYGPEEHPLRGFEASFYGSASRGQEWIDSFALHACVSGERCFLEIEGKHMNAWAVALNTAWAHGDVFRFMARMHGQCEIHAWIDGSDRKWIADIIRSGVKCGLLSADAYGYDGWLAVADMLELRNDGPVVTSYSVCESFPNAHVSGWNPKTDKDGEEDWDAWYDKPKAEQWESAMAGLRKSGRGLELRSDRTHGKNGDEWSDFYFDKHEINAYQLMHMAHKARRPAT